MTKLTKILIAVICVLVIVIGTISTLFIINMNGHKKTTKIETSVSDDDIDETTISSTTKVTTSTTKTTTMSTTTTQLSVEDITFSNFPEDTTIGYVNMKDGTSFLNVREKPSTDSEVLGQLSQYCGLSLYEFGDPDWYLIRYDAKMTVGYVSKEFVGIGEPPVSMSNNPNAVVTDEYIQSFLDGSRTNDNGSNDYNYNNNSNVNEYGISQSDFILLTAPYYENDNCRISNIKYTVVVEDGEYVMKIVSADLTNIGDDLGNGGLRFGEYGYRLYDESGVDVTSKSLTIHYDGATEFGGVYTVMIDNCETKAINPGTFYLGKEYVSTNLALNWEIKQNGSATREVRCGPYGASHETVTFTEPVDVWTDNYVRG